MCIHRQCVRRMISEIVKPADQFTSTDFLTGINQRLPNTIARAWDVVFQVRGLDEARRRSTIRVNPDHFFAHKPIMPQDVSDPFVCVPCSDATDSLGATEFTANRNFPLVLSFISEQAGSHPP